jgi:secondary thiamine-phosphate synthase enzyme
MPTHLHREEIPTQGDAHVIELTPMAEKAIADSGLTEGTVTAFALHTTVGLTTMEHEPGTAADLGTVFRRLAPQGEEYHHNRLNADTNGHAHAQAAMLGASVTLPFSSGRLLLGTWQALVAVDFDDRPRRRQIVFQVIGE